MKKDYVKLEKFSPERARKSKVIAVMNNKGGCGKTTTAIALAMHYARTGANVLCWDNDPQSNMSQRLGLPDSADKDERLGQLFRNADKLSSRQKNPDLNHMVKYKYRMRYPGVKLPGLIGLMGGDHFAEVDANAAEAKLRQSTFIDPGDRNIYKYFYDSVSFYKDYFDYIIMDTAPALEGNILNKLAVRTAEYIISPVDGLEAALGLQTFLRWANSETDPSEMAGRKRPSVLLVMVKYAIDTKELLSVIPDVRARNAVFRALASTFGDYVCLNGVQELRKMQGTVAGFGRKTDYEALAFELIGKMAEPGPSLLDNINNRLFEEFDGRLRSIEAKTLPKKAIFKRPYYGVGTPADEVVVPHV